MMILNNIKIIKITRTIVTAIAQDKTTKSRHVIKPEELINLRKYDIVQII